MMPVRPSEAPGHRLTQDTAPLSVSQEDSRQEGAEAWHPVTGAGF